MKTTTHFMRPFGLVIALCAAFLFSCGGGGTAVTPPTNNPPGYNTGPGGTVDPNNGNTNPDPGTTTIKIHSVSPEGGPVPMITTTIMQPTRDSSSVGGKKASDLNFAPDRDVLHSTLNAQAIKLWDEGQLSHVMSAPGLPWDGISYTCTWPWTFGTTTCFYNAYSITADDVLVGGHAYQYTDGLNIHLDKDIVDGFKASANSGLIGDMYAYYSTVVPDGDLTTTTDHCLGSDPTVLVHLDNFTQNHNYSAMADVEFQTVVDDSGNDGANLALWDTLNRYGPGAGRFSLALFDMANYLKAAALTHNTVFANQIASWLKTNEGLWKHVNFGGDDYTVYGWGDMEEALSVLYQKQGGVLTGDSLALFQECSTNTGDIYTVGGEGFYNGIWHYWGVPANNLIQQDQTQVGSYALAGQAASNLYYYNYTDQNTIDSLYGGLYWFQMNILSTHSDGTILDGWRGKQVGGDPSTWENQALNFRALANGTDGLESRPF